MCGAAQLEINGRSLSIISEAVGGTNVDNCPHACIKKPCGPFAECIPNFDNYECQCSPTNFQCNKAEELTSQQIDAMVKEQQTTTMPMVRPQDNLDAAKSLRTMPVAAAAAASIQNGFTDANNGPGNGVYETTIQIVANKRKGMAASGVVAPTTMAYDDNNASADNWDAETVDSDDTPTAYSLNNQNDYGGSNSNDDDTADAVDAVDADADANANDYDNDEYYDYNQNTKENAAQTDDDGK